MKRKARKDSTSLGNVVAALYNVPLRSVHEAAQRDGLIGESLIAAGHITRPQLEAALTSQQALRGGRNRQREILRGLLKDIAKSADEIRKFAEVKS